MKRLSLCALALFGLSTAACGSETSSPSAPVDDTGIDAFVETGDGGITCGLGLTLCGDKCVEIKSDLANCGGCGKVCESGKVCSAGSCQTTCGGDLKECSGSCRDVTVDPKNCGDCGKSCAAGEVCSAGKCGLTCASPLTLCGGSSGGDAGADADASPPTGSYCATLQTDRFNCGTCGTTCAAGQVCNAGKCESSCAAGTIDCGDGKCRDLSSDNAKCGTSCATAVACAAGKVCTAGACASTCAAGTTDCGDGKCRDLSSDSAVCGTSCATAVTCAPGKVCTAGACASTCAAGTIDCGDGKCRDLSSDNAKCGTSCSTAVACAAGKVCTAGACVASCATGLTACSGVCTNTAYDPANCGACGSVCGSGLACLAGACRFLAGSATKLYLANWAAFNTNFNVYNIATGTWSAGPALPVTSRGQLATTGGTVRMYGTDNFVYEYTPSTNTWAKGIAGPALSSYSFFQYLNGNMYLCQANTTTLNIHNGTAWSTVTLPAACSIAGGIDPSAKEVYIKRYSQAGFTVVSATTNTIVRTITDATSIGENTSSAAFLGGTFYTRSSTGTIWALAGISGARTDTALDPGGNYPGFVTDSAAGVIYMLSSSSFKSFKPGSGLTTLTAGPTESTVATITLTY